MYGWSSDEVPQKLCESIKIRLQFDKNYTHRVYRKTYIFIQYWHILMVFNGALHRNRESDKGHLSTGSTIYSK
jgi:hypothetical protein